MRAVNIVRKFFPEVKTVKDAKEDNSIQVTEEDCASSGIKDHRSCAMAEACKRQLGLEGAIISTNIAYLINGDTAFRYMVPESVSREVVSFDRNGGFLPGSYQLKAPAKGHRLGEHYAEKTKKRKYKKHRKIVRHLTGGIRKALSATA